MHYSHGLFSLLGVSISQIGCLEDLNGSTKDEWVKAAEAQVLGAGDETGACKGSDSVKPNSREM